MKTDIQLQQDVMTELKWQPSINAATIGVEAREGVVTLSGQVGTYAEKIAVEQATQRVAGVMALTIHIAVTPSGWAGRTDIDIARSVEETLRWVTYLPKDSVKVMVEKGWVTLSGELEWDYQRRYAIDSVRHLSGVQGIRDAMRIKTQAHSGEIRLDIEAALKRHFDSEDQDISVAVQDGFVTLSGTVTNWWQLDSAREAAWNTVGVRHVANKLIIAA